MTETEIRAALDDRLALAGTLFGEGAGLPTEGRVAIGCVARNRLRAKNRFGRSWRAVCLNRAAFSCWWRFGGRENQRRLLRLVEQVLEGQVPTLTARERAVWADCLRLADAFLAGEIPDAVCGATHYYSPAAMVPRGSRPMWALDDTKLVAVIGEHRFFAGIA